MKRDSTKRSAKSAAPFRYTFGGLEGIYLADGFERVETGYGAGVVFHDLDGLHEAIGEQIARARPSGLSGAEIRFLRELMGCTQRELAGLLGATEQTLARWETGKTAMPGPADLLLRALCLQHLGKPVDLRRFGPSVRSAAGAGKIRWTFEPAARGWRVRAG